MASGQQMPRIPLVENYDPQYGFITDAFVDPQGTVRAPLMARPAVKTDTVMGPTPAPITGSDCRVVATRLFTEPVTEESEPTLGGDTFVAFIYSKQKTPGTFTYGVALYNYTTQSYVGATDLSGSLLSFAEVAPRAKFSSPANPPLTVITAGIASAGTGYVVNDTIGLTLSAGKQAGLKVTSINGSGGVTGVAIVGSGITGTQPANPVAQATTSGVGTGATFNLSYEMMFGLIFQYATNQPDNVNFVGVGNSTGNYYQFHISSSIDLYGTPTVVCLNNYNFYLDTQGNIWNSDAGDATTINGLSFTAAFSDTSTEPIDLAVHNGYLVAIGSNQVRFFQVTGATNGSSVAPIQNLEFGIGSKQFSNDFYTSTVGALDEVLAFVGEDDSTGAPVYMFSPASLTPSRVSYPLIENIISTGIIEATGIQSADFIHFRGHIAYMITPVLAGPTYIYDLSSKLWYLWNISRDSNSSTGISPFASLYNFNDVTYMVSYSTTGDTFYIARLFEAGTDTPTGYTAPAYVPQITLKPLDFGSMLSKQFESVAIVGDQVTTALSAGISYSDDSGQNFTADRTVALNQRRPITRNLGQGYRRNWRVKLPTDWTVRIDSIEVTYGVGAS